MSADGVRFAVHARTPPATSSRPCFTLDEVAELLDIGRRGHRATDLQERAKAKITEVERKIADRTTIRDARNEVVAARCDSLTRCTCPDCPLPFAELADPDGEAR